MYDVTQHHKGGMHMAENIEINALLEKYKNLFEKSPHMDVAQTAKGRWFFLEYDVKYNKYHSFCEFKTSDELERLIAGIIADDTNTLLEVGLSDMIQSLESVDISADFELRDYSECLPQLIENMKALHESQERHKDLLKRVTEAIECVLDTE